MEEGWGLAEILPVLQLSRAGVLVPVKSKQGYGQVTERNVGRLFLQCPPLKGI